MARESSRRGSYAKGTRTREALIDAALEHFSRSGYRGAQLASIATSVGVTRSAVLHHFSSKEELLAAALDRRDAIAAERLAGHRDNVDSGSLAFSSLLRDTNVHSRGLVQFFTALVGEAVADDHPAHAHVRDRYAATRQMWRDLLEEARQRGEIPGDVDVDRAAPLLIAVMDGLQIQWLYDESIDISSLLDSFIEVLPRRGPSPAAEAAAGRSRSE